MLKKRHILWCIHTYAIVCFGSSVEMRFGIGPAWHNFFSYEEYVLTQEGFDAGFVPAEEIKTRYDLMPYFEGRMRGYFGNHYHMQMIAGGGFFTKNVAQITEYLGIIPAESIPGESDPLFSGSIVTLDINNGCEFFLGSSCFALNPLVGYVYNQQHLKFKFLNLTQNYAIANRWQGPYIGLEASLNYSSLLLRTFYKWVPGKLHVRFRAHVLYNPEAVGQSSNAPFSYCTTSMFGNLFGMEGSYMILPSWRLGTSFMYEHYANRKFAPVTSVPARTDFFSAVRFDDVIWNQIVWLFFVEHSF